MCVCDISLPEGNWGGGQKVCERGLIAGQAGGPEVGACCTYDAPWLVDWNQTLGSGLCLCGFLVFQFFRT